ncbi:MAG: InlB B-repeat-containing protein, partial [Gemmatirosa sp.]
GACLNDPQRRVGSTGGDGACTVRLTLTLLLDQRVLDEQTAGPFVLQPGVTVTAPSAVTLYEVRTVRIDLPAGAVTRPDGSVRLEVGSGLTLGAAALDPAGAGVAGRTAAWVSSAPTVATVGASTGLVTAVAPGTARITATVGGRATAVDVVVVPRSAPLTITAGGTGSGTIRSTPAGIDCRIVNGQPQGACTFAFPGDAQVSLFAVTQVGSGFAGWGDVCAASGTSTTCVVTTDQARTVRATFGVLRTLSVGGAGDGAGTITGAPGGIACTVGANAAGSCSAQLLDGTTVTLTATPASGSTFVDWSGDCAGATGSTCTLTVSEALRGASARFARPQGLTVNVAGTGEGSVSAAVGGSTIACVRRAGETTGACSATAPFNTVVTLTATPDANSTFAGWTGACSGTGPCTVTVDQARSVGATFTRRQVTLTVVVGGAGAGAITANGDRCELAAGQGSQSCTLRVDVARPVTLTAVPATGSEFGTWSGACAASERSPTCTLTPSTDASVGATFVPGAVRVTIVGEANTSGIGTVSSGDGRLACTVRGASTTGTCEALVPVGTTLTLDASHDATSTFGSWSGACAGTAGARCTLTVRTATSVGARFLRQQTPLSIGVSGSGAGTVSLNGAPACTLAANQGSTSCARVVDAGASVTLTLQPAAGSTASWGGPCASAPVNGPCTFVPATTGASVPVSFALVAPTQPTISVRPVAGYTGGGRVRSSDQRIDCTIAPTTGAISGTCDAVYTTGATVSLSLVSFTMERFVGTWSGLCTSSSTTCIFSAPATGGTARVSLPEFVDLSLNWTGSGSVATTFADSAGRLLTCSGVPGSFQCSAIAPEGSTVTFTATSPFAGGLQGWTDGCAAAGTASTCTRTVPFQTSGNPPYLVGARFDFQALVDVGGGAGTVALQGVTGPNSACTNSGLGTTTCSLRSPTRTATLVATAAVGNVFIGWDSPACLAPVPTCTVDVTSANGRVTASFQAQGPLGLEFDRDPAGTGEGRVITSLGTCNLPLAGRNGACSEVAQVGSTRSYTAQPFAGSQFVSWGGPCAGQVGTTCTLSPVTVGGTILARFDLTPTQLLTVEGINSVTPGTGTVTSSPSGINCTVTGNAESGTCTGTFALNANVSLTPTPASGYVFSAWSGACSGSTVPCVVPMNGPRTVGALFVPAPTPLLTVQGSALSGDVGAGFVTSVTPTGITCSVSGAATAGTCSQSFPLGTNVTLDATALSTNTFLGWTGACSGTSPTCIVAMTQARTVGARFAPQFSQLVLAFDAQSVQRGFLSTNVGLNCSDTPENEGLSGNACAPTGGSVTTGTSVTVTASGQLPGSGFVGWTGSGPCAGVQATTCTFTISGPTTVTGRFGGLMNPTLELQNDASFGGGQVAVQTIRGSTQFAQAAPGTQQISLNLFTGDVVRFTASPTGGALFDGWDGECASFGTNPVCTVSNTFPSNLVRARFVEGSALRSARPARRAVSRP